MNMKQDEKQRMLRCVASVLDRHEADCSELRLDSSVLSSTRTQLSKYYGSEYKVEFGGRKKKKYSKKREEQAKAPSTAEASTTGKKSNKVPLMAQVATLFRQSPSVQMKARTERTSINSGTSGQFSPETLSRSGTSKSLDIKTVSTKNGKQILVAKAGSSGKIQGWARHSKKESAPKAKPDKQQPESSKRVKIPEKKPKKPPVEHNKRQSKTRRQSPAEDNDARPQSPAEDNDAIPVATAIGFTATEAPSVAGVDNVIVEEKADEPASQVASEPSIDTGGPFVQHVEPTAGQAGLGDKGREVSESPHELLGGPEPPGEDTIVVNAAESEDTTGQERPEPETVDGVNFGKDLPHEAQESPTETQEMAAEVSESIATDELDVVLPDSLQDVVEDDVLAAPENAAEAPETPLDAVEEGEPIPATEVEGII